MEIIQARVTGPHSHQVGGSVMLLDGTDDETGDRLLIAAEPRLGRDILRVIELEGECLATVDAWAIISRTKAVAS